jgi:SAM-dependent methyltransferase
MVMERRLRLSKKGVRAYRLVVATLKKSKKLRGRERHLLTNANKALASEIHKAVIGDIRRRHWRSALEIGCGDGKILRKLARMKEFRDSYLCGIDKSPKAIREAAGKSKRASPAKKVQFSVGRNGRIPYPGKFDLIFTILSFHEWKNGYKSIPYILDRVDSGGAFIIYETMPIDTERFRKYRKYGIRLVIKKTLELAKVAFYRNRD